MFDINTISFLLASTSKHLIFPALQDHLLLLDRQKGCIAAQVRHMRGALSISLVVVHHIWVIRREVAKGAEVLPIGSLTVVVLGSLLSIGGEGLLVVIGR